MKDTKKSVEILKIYSVDHDGIDEDGSTLTYKVVPLGQAEDVLRMALAKQRHDLKGQVLEDGGPTIDEVEQWLNKLDLLTSRGSKIVHVKHLLMKYRQRIEAVFAKEE